MKKGVVLGVSAVVLLLAGWMFFRGRGERPSEIEFRYAKVERGELVRSISATGAVVALTTVDVKSKAGGKVVRLAVDEGTVVKKGDLIAIIDPADTRAVVEQAEADLRSANARAEQAAQSHRLQIAQNRTNVADARAALEAAKVRLRRAAIESRRQPALSRSGVRTANATLNSALASQRRVQRVTVPGLRREAQSALSQAKAERDTAAAELRRQEALLVKGYVAAAAVERARAAAEGANSAYSTAQQRAETIEDEVQALLETEQRAVERARAALEEAQANITQNDVRRTDVAEAQKAVRSAEIALQRAQEDVVQNEVRRSEVLAARAATVRNRVSVQNARVQLESTTVVAPRDGVVTQKYLEEGTIIPAGTSTFAQGPAIVQLSDVTQLYIECAVDEADVAEVKINQKVRILAEAFPGQTLDGVVTRVNPAAKTEQNITAVKVRVRVLPGAKVQVLPGMTATCEFITLEKKGVLVAPTQAVRQGEGRATVRVKNPAPDKPPLEKVVEVGETGNEGVEIKSGLTEGEEVVVAEIDKAALLETQKKMQEAQEGGGLAGGGGPKGPSRRPAAGGRGGGGGGGGRGGGGGGR